ncbi:Ribosomal protein L11 methyltransferase [Trichinella pseudospiralis]
MTLFTSHRTLTFIHLAANTRCAKWSTRASPVNENCAVEQSSVQWSLVNIFTVIQTPPPEASTIHREPNLYESSFYQAMMTTCLSWKAAQAYTLNVEMEDGVSFLNSQTDGDVATKREEPEKETSSNASLQTSNRWISSNKWCDICMQNIYTFAKSVHYFDATPYQSQTKRFTNFTNRRFGTFCGITPPASLDQGFNMILNSTSPIFHLYNSSSAPLLKLKMAAHYHATAHENHTNLQPIYSAQHTNLTTLSAHCSHRCQH